MSENATIDRTQELQKSCAPLFGILTEQVQHFLTATEGVFPYIESTADGFIVHDLPKDTTLQQIIDGSAFEIILHSIRHLYTDGSTKGKTSALEQVKNGGQLQNNSLRMYITYIYTLQPEYTETCEICGQKLIVSFSPNNFTNNPHRILKKISLKAINAEQFEELQRTNSIVGYTKHTITAWCKMTAEELNTHISAYISTCKEEIQEHINKVARHACANGEQPNYLVFG